MTNWKGAITPGWITDHPRGWHLKGIPQPTTKAFILDSIYTPLMVQPTDVQPRSTDSGAPKAHLRHNTSSNVLFADGHVTGNTKNKLVNEYDFLPEAVYP